MLRVPSSLAQNLICGFMVLHFHTCMPRDHPTAHLLGTVFSSAVALQEQETEYAVSPNTPLLSTEVQQNAWVCGEQQDTTAWGVCSSVQATEERRRQQQQH